MTADNERYKFELFKGIVSNPANSMQTCTSEQVCACVEKLMIAITDVKFGVKGSK